MGHREKVNLTPIYIVYEPIYDEYTPIQCYFTDQVHLPYGSYVDVNVKGSEKNTHSTIRECQYCENFFAKNNAQMKKYTDVCSAKESISYCFQNGEIISFQDNFRYLGNVPFTVYFDFETTTGDAVIFNPEMYVISYCQIYSFHPSINLDKIVTLRSFQQKADEIYDLSHFKREHVPFFDKTTF